MVAVHEPSDNPNNTIPIPTYTMEIDSKETVYRIAINENEDIQKKEKQRIIDRDEESTKDAVKQILLPVILSGFGNMAAGIILDTVQYWTVFRKIPQLIILVPALLGLKGNVEMTLSSRLGTAANLGVLEDKKKRRMIVIGSISLAQCQASAIGLLTPLIGLGIGYIRGGFDDLSDDQKLNLMKILLVMACAVITSGLADLILSSLMCFICVVSQICFKINSDNISTPIAASVGDLATMGFLAITAKLLYDGYQTVPWVSIIPICIWSGVTVTAGYIARHNEFTKKIVFTGWTPLVVSMIIQNTSGAILESFLQRFDRMAAFQPVINGFGGNLVAVQSSRIATYLHKYGKKKQLPESDPHIFIGPWKLFFGKGPHGKLALILSLMAGPLQLPFVILIRFVTQRAILTPQFVVTYYVCCTIQVIVMLYIGYCFVHFLWRFGFNPDNSAIPILTALADLLGSIFLACGFLVLNAINDPNAALKIAVDSTSNVTTTTTIAAVINNATISQ
ncbi:solute carrier family 41 member 1-like protein [Dinothrombium tinctorium]|uniref:Solute carrier family 41 member 1-like protein n=1 Tax=Dinothrombium tinctorium TaxID=1965070 RepID=A0A3S3P3S2_9ACAR|nr:solute carrier family 41 member 1-like protein [Dinothrombium tinctorium]